MKKIILILGIIFLLTSCYSNPEDKKKIEELEKEIQENNILKNKQECFSYKDDLVNELKQYLGSPSDISLFYSKKINSCIASYSVYHEGHGMGNFIVDYLSNEQLYHGFCPDDDVESKCSKVYSDYNDKIDELKK